MNDFKKVAVEWAEKYLSSEEGLKFKKEVDRDFLNYMLFGIPYCFNTEFLEGTISSSRLKRDEIIDRFRHQLTEKELEELKNKV